MVRLLHRLAQVNGALAPLRPAAPFLLLELLKESCNRSDSWCSRQVDELPKKLCLDGGNGDLLQEMKVFCFTCSSMKCGTCTRFEPSASRLQGTRGSAEANSFRTWQKEDVLSRFSQIDVAIRGSHVVEVWYLIMSNLKNSTSLTCSVYYLVIINCKKASTHLLLWCLI